MLAYSIWVWIMEHPKTMERKLDAAENKWLRRMLKISYREHVKNEEVRRKTQHLQINDIIKRRKVKWAGHVPKMNDSRTSKESSNTSNRPIKPEGERAVGRSTRRWADIIGKGFKAIELHRMTEERQRLTIEEIASQRPRTMEGCHREISG